MLGGGRSEVYRPFQNLTKALDLLTRKMLTWTHKFGMSFQGIHWHPAQEIRSPFIKNTCHKDDVIRKGPNF